MERLVSFVEAKFSVTLALEPEMEHASIGKVWGLKFTGGGGGYGHALEGTGHGRRGVKWVGRHE